MRDLHSFHYHSPTIHKLKLKIKKKKKTKKRKLSFPLMQEILGPATSFALGVSLSSPIGKLFMPLFVAYISNVGLMWL